VCCGAFATRRNIEAPVGEVSQASACACVRDVPVTYAPCERPPRFLSRVIWMVSRYRRCRCKPAVIVCRFLMVDQVAANYDFSWFRALGQAVLGGRTPDG
jgi:hypothetical protein